MECAGARSRTRSRPTAKPASTWRCSSSRASSWAWHSQTLRIRACFMRGPYDSWPRARSKRQFCRRDSAVRGGDDAQPHAPPLAFGVARRTLGNNANFGLIVGDELPDEIVVRGLRDLDAAERPRRGLATREVHLAVDFRGLAGVPPHEHVFVLVARPLDEHFERLADELLIFGVGDRALQRHELAVARGGDFRRHLAVEG